MMFLPSTFEDAAVNRGDLLSFGKGVQKTLHICSRILERQGLDIGYHANFSSRKTADNCVIFDSEKPVLMEDGTLWCSVLEKRRNIFVPLLKIWGEAGSRTAFVINPPQDPIPYPITPGNITLFTLSFEAYLLSFANEPAVLVLDPAPARPH